MQVIRTKLASGFAACCSMLCPHSTALQGVDTSASAVPSAHLAAAAAAQQGQDGDYCKFSAGTSSRKSRSSRRSGSPSAQNCCTSGGTGASQRRSLAATRAMTPVIALHVDCWAAGNSQCVGCSAQPYAGKIHQGKWRSQDLSPRQVLQHGAHIMLGMYCGYMGAGPRPTGLSSGTAGSSSLSAARSSRCSSGHPDLAAAWCSDQAGIAGQAAPAAAACSIRGNGRSGGGGRGGLYQLLTVSGHECAASISTLQLASHLAACMPTG